MFKQNGGSARTSAYPVFALLKSRSTYLSDSEFMRTPNASTRTPKKVRDLVTALQNGQ